MKVPRTTVTLVFLLAVSGSMVRTLNALDAIPQYEAVDIGSIIRDAYPSAGISSGWALNESGDVVGAALIDSEFHAFIYTEAWGMQILPPLLGWTNHIGQDVSDRDAQGIVLIVGGAGQTTQLSDSDPGYAVMWRYDTVQGEAVEIVDVGHLPGNGVSELTAVNNNGLAVGYSRIGLTQGPYEPMVYEASTGVLHPLAALSTAPVDINDANQVLAGTIRAQLSQDPGTGVISVSSTFDLSTEPGERIPGVTSALNNLGWASGTAYMGYTIDGRAQLGAALYDNVIWDIVWSASSVNRAEDLNIHGDVVGQHGPRTAVKAALYIRALDQVFLLEELTDPPIRWRSARGINDAGWITGGGAGAVLWKRIGDMPVPTPPANLTAVPHEPTWVQPWNAITLAWEDTSTLTRTFTIERSLSGADNWAVIRSDWSPLSYHDTSVELATTYDYRVRASGIAGTSEPSNVATATSPADPLDTEAPVVNFVTPLDGETVTGTVPIVVEATDNNALEYVDVVLVIDSSRQQICEDFVDGAADSTTLSCNWNTRDMLTRWYTLEAHASDTLGNWDLEIIQVWLEGTGQCNFNGVCDAVEDCNSCPSDCPGQTSGHPSQRWCCGDGLCSPQEDGLICAVDCGAPPVCGDAVCDAGEDTCSCAVDCGTPPANELPGTTCGDNVDNDCDGLEDCDDADCTGSDECLCGGKNATCTTNADCCSGTCKRNGRCQ